MGNSFNLIKYDIYISFSEENENITLFENNLKSLNLNTLNSSLLINNIKLPNDILQQHIKSTINNNELQQIFICVSKNIYKSFSQIIETNEFIINELVDTNNIIYLMVDEEFTPLNSNVECLIGNNKWYPFYNKSTVEDSYNKILVDLKCAILKNNLEII
jgi:hypothetical protein